MSSMRALLQERSAQRQQGLDVGASVLYFGCKKRDQGKSLCSACHGAARQREGDLAACERSKRTYLRVWRDLNGIGRGQGASRRGTKSGRHDGKPRGSVCG